MWMQLLFLLLVIGLGWLLYRQIKGNPQAFSSENMHKSLWTLGLLALFLICFVGFVVMLVRHGG
jgi:hypothetical protein